MSKQSQAKAAQGYVSKPAFATCGNCAHMRTTMAMPHWMRLENNRSPGKWGEDQAYVAKKHCERGGFAVVAGGTCDWHKLKGEL